MSQWRIDSERTQFRISFRPGPPGVSVHVHGITGTFEATIDEHGRPQMGAPLGGEFAMTVDDLELGNTVLTGAVRRWLGGDDEIAVAGRIGKIVPAGDGGYRLAMGLHLRGRTHTLVGRGRTRLTPGGHLRVTGRTFVDPRDLGVPVPPLLRFRSVADWDIDLAPELAAAG